MSADRRWRLDIAYDGSNFAGWAAQAGRRTVQGELELWLTRVLALSEPARLVCAGRTDAGVHARGQVAQLDAPAAVELDARLLRRLNGVLGGDVVVRRATLAPPGFDARFAAVWRRYVYRLADLGPPDPLLRSHVVALRRPLELDRVNQAGARLLGLRDFGAFCKQRAGATTIRKLLELHAERVSGGPLAGVIECTVRADAFCHSMVRSLIGALTEVGTGRRDLAWLDRVTRSATRDTGVPLMPAAGLTLEEVGYPADQDLADRVAQARTRRELA